jgi:hypothetical protein
MFGCRNIAETLFPNGILEVSQWWWHADVKPHQKSWFAHAQLQIIANDSLTSQVPPTG